MSASSMASLSEISRTTAGISFSPARRAARQRRSPATILYPPTGTGRTTMGCKTPCFSMARRQFRQRFVVKRLARLLAVGEMSAMRSVAVLSPPLAVVSSNSELKPRPSPPFFAAIRPLLCFS